MNRRYFSRSNCRDYYAKLPPDEGYIYHIRDRIRSGKVNTASH